MPFGLSQITDRFTGSSNQPKQASLDDLLPSHGQKTDLIVLVAVCIDRMRDELLVTLSSTSSTTGNDEASTTDKSKPQSLEDTALKYFDDWRDKLLKRMEEAMHVKEHGFKTAKQQYDSATTKVATNASKTSNDTNSHRRLYPIVTLPQGLQVLDEQTRRLVLGAVLFMVLSLENYPAQSRLLMIYVCQCFELSYKVLNEEEATTAATMLQVVEKSGIDAEEARAKKEKESNSGRKTKIALATVAGAAVIGITGGLAAPLIAGIVGTSLGVFGLGGLATLLGATLLNPITVTAFFGVLGGRMSNRAMDAYSQGVEDFKFLPLVEYKPDDLTPPNQPENKRPNPTQKLRLTIGISGWVTEEQDVVKPWYVLSNAGSENFALQYEVKALQSLGSTLMGFLAQTGFGVVRGQAIKFVLPELAAALAPFGLLNAGKFLNNPFTIALERSDKAGKVLATALISRVQGERPVTLIGHSMGARVIYSCLQELAAQKAFGLVENAVLIGSPIPSNESSWRTMHAVVAGRLVNVYAEKDVLLAYLYRARNLQLSIAGLQAITAPNVENLDVSSYVNGHNQYHLAIGRILKDLNFADLDLEQIRLESLELEQEKAHEEEVHEEAKKSGQLKDLEDENGQLKMDNTKHDQKA